MKETWQLVWTAGLCILVGWSSRCVPVPPREWVVRQTNREQSERAVLPTNWERGATPNGFPPKCRVCAARRRRGAAYKARGSEKTAGVDGGVPAGASVSRAEWKNRASSLCMWVSRSDPGTGFVRSRQRFAHRSHVGLIEREAPSCESCGWCATGGAQKSRFGRGRGPRMDSKMPARDPQAAYTYVALHSVQVHWPDRRPRAGLRGVEMRTPQEGGASNGVQNLGMGCRGTGSRGSIPPMLMLRVRGFVKGFL